MKCYISGPIGDRAFGDWAPRFDLAKAKIVAEYGTKGEAIYVASPADTVRAFPQDTIRQLQERDISDIIYCDTIYMLTGWEKSPGARVEHALAVWLCHRIIYENGDR